MEEEGRILGTIPSNIRADCTPRRTAQFERLANVGSDDSGHIGDYPENGRLLHDPVMEEWPTIRELTRQ